MRVSVLALVLILISLQINGQQLGRQLQEVGSIISQAQSSSSQTLQQTVVNLLWEKNLTAAADIIILNAQEDKMQVVIDAIVQIVDSKERTVIQRLSDALVVLSNESPGVYGELLSAGLGAQQASINAFDRLLCLQTNSNPNLCYGIDAAEEMKTAEVYEGYTISEDFGDVQTDPKSVLGEKLLSQLKNGDYNSAAWTVVGNVADFNNEDYSRAINSAAMDGAGGAAGESMLHSLRLASREGVSEEVSLLLAELMVQNYRKDVIPLLGKASAFASLDGLDDGVQRMVRAAIEQGGDVRSVLEVMNQIAAQGGDTGVKDMAIVVVGAETSGAQLATLVQVLAYSMCRGGVFWDSFSRIYNKAVDLYDCDSIKKSFNNGYNTAQSQCPDELPTDLYTTSPSLQACKFTKSVAKAPAKFLESTVATSDMIPDVLKSDVQPVVEPLSVPAPETVDTTAQEIVTVPEAIDEVNQEVAQIQEVAQTKASPQGILGDTQSVLQRFMAQLSESGGDEAVEESTTIATPTAPTTTLAAALTEKVPVGTSQTKSSQVATQADVIGVQPQCLDVAPEDNITASCEERKSWGGCEKDWMMEENFCAKTCGFCSVGTSGVQTSNIMTEQQQVTVEEPEVERVISSTATKKTRGGNKRCKDVVPKDNSTASCLDRKEWGSCEKDWMIEGDYCAKTCGYCPTSSAPKPAPATTLLSQIASTTPKQQPNKADDTNVIATATATATVPIAEREISVVTPAATAAVVDKPAPIQPAVVPAEQNIVEESTPALSGLLAQIASRLSDGQKQDSQRKRSGASDTLLIEVSNDCIDVEPVSDTDEAISCAERKDWGACEAYWMIQGNYCALTCGYCTSSTQA